MQEKILLFIPCYNCEKQIVRVLKQLDTATMQYITQVLVVNNRSTDGTEDAAREYLVQHNLPAVLVRNSENYGLGGSHKVAFNYAIEHGFDYVVVLHGDDQGRIGDLIPYLESGEAFHYDSFLGTRFERESKLVNYSAFRIFGNHVFNAFLSAILKKKVTDLGAGLNMYKVSYLNNRFFLYFINSLTFNVYMLLYGAYCDSKFKFFPLEWREEDQISNAKFIKQSQEIFKIALRYLFHPQRTFAAADNEYSRISYSYEVIYKSRDEKNMTEARRPPSTVEQNSR